jgi:phosphoadenosine phosphosulfate reductase
MLDFEPKITRIEAKLRDYRESGFRVFATSSFQSNSVVLLHVIGTLDASIPIYFLDTGFHFPETLRFRDSLAERLGLDIRVLRSPVSRIQQRDSRDRLLFASDPDHCCHLNKVLPLEPVLLSNDVWISGVRASQSSHRAAMGEEARGRHGILRYHPLLDWSAKDVHYYIEEHALPRHPLESENYFSIGCRPCTRRMDPEQLYDDRGGRWFGMNKTECGLHMDVQTPGDGGAS